jgi:hypothetical protein
VRKLSRVQEAAAGILVVIALTVALWVAGVIDSASTVTAFATSVLAVGTVGLAVGAIGTYLEQRKTSQVQGQQLEAQARRLELARENDVAQVAIRRMTGGGDYLAVEVTNRSSRLIRYLYVWVDVQGMSPVYQMVVAPEDAYTTETFASRRMQHVRRTVDGHAVEWCYRSLPSGETVKFDQFKLTNDQPVPSVADEWIRTYAVFADVEGTWWKCSEDGEVEKLPQEPPEIFKEPMLEPGVIAGLRQLQVPRTPDKPAQA